MQFVPTVILKKHSKEYAYDIFSRLLEDRIIMLSGEINDDVASSIISQLLYLESLDATADIICISTHREEVFLLDLLSMTQ